LRGFWWRNVEERDCLKDPGVHETLILRWILKGDRMEGGGLALSGLSILTGGGL
jgi:hypothetical protein